MIIDCVSDLHGHYPKLQGGDLLIIAGDLTDGEQEVDYLKFYSWLHKQNYTKFIVIAGNHDNSIEREETIIKFLDQTVYLQDEGTEFGGLKIWGSPWTQTFEDMNPRCKAFTMDTEEELAEKWKLIPDDVDILITHSPPYGIRDEIHSTQQCASMHVGSTSLFERIVEIQEKGEKKERLLICGHIHEGCGQQDLYRRGSTEIGWSIINASHVNEYYEPVNKPFRVTKGEIR